MFRFPVGNCTDWKLEVRVQGKRAILDDTSSVLSPAIYIRENDTLSFRIKGPDTVALDVYPVVKLVAGGIYCGGKPVQQAHRGNIAVCDMEEVQKENGGSLGKYYLIVYYPANLCKKSLSDNTLQKFVRINFR